MATMSLPPPFPVDCRLVVFDLDGTLYRQSKLRWTMLGELLTEGGAGKLRRIRDLGRFRKLREDLSDAGQPGFDAELFSRAAALTGRSEKDMRALVQVWMEERPLRHLRAARVEGTAELFEALRAKGISIAIWSDYPIAAKRAALGLKADMALAATDPELDTLKPNPRGLAMLLERAGCRPDQALMVGDRMSRDGAAAAALGVAFLLRSAKDGPTGVPRVVDFTKLAAAVFAAVQSSDTGLPR